MAQYASSRSILLIEDDAETSELLTQYLQKNGFEVAATRSPKQALELLPNAKPCLVLIDLMLPENSGSKICRELRKSFDIPILILSGPGEGLDLDADDYLPKPYEPRELLARIQSVLRRSVARGTQAQESKLRFNDLEIDCRRRTITLAAVPVELSSAEFDALMLLVRSHGEIVSREAMFNALHGQQADTVISRLRTKLGDDPQRPAFIRTVRGAGYIFVAAPASLS
jgi:DNA-binding response OmpR family regulator